MEGGGGVHIGEADSSTGSSLYLSCVKGAGGGGAVPGCRSWGEGASLLPPSPPLRLLEARQAAMARRSVMTQPLVHLSLLSPLSSSRLSTSISKPMFTVERA